MDAKAAPADVQQGHEDPEEAPATPVPADLEAGGAEPAGNNDELKVEDDAKATATSAAGRHAFIQNSMAPLASMFGAHSFAQLAVARPLRVIRVAETTVLVPSPPEEKKVGVRRRAAQRCKSCGHAITGHPKGSPEFLAHHHVSGKKRAGCQRHFLICKSGDSSQTVALLDKDTCSCKKYKRKRNRPSGRRRRRNNNDDAQLE